MGNINLKGTYVIDLSQAIEPGIPVPVGFPKPKLEMFLSQQEGDVANVEILHMTLHTATHCDAPFHFFSNLSRIDEIEPDYLIGPAIVVDLTYKSAGEAIEADDFRRWEASAREKIKPDEIVLLHTGHSYNWKLGQDASMYWEKGWPFLTREAVDYLVSKSIRAIGVESFDPDWVDPKNLSSAEFPTHRTFLPKGILIIENLTNLDKIPSTHCQIIALPLKLKGCSGSPLRVIALV